MMKDWLSIGEFAELVGVSARTLRVYEEASLISSHARGENNYRYYRREQAELMKRILEFKRLGFSLGEIRALLVTDGSMTADHLCARLLERRAAITETQSELARQAQQIDSILTSLTVATVGLTPRERRYIMSQYEKLSIVVTGTTALAQTARLIQSQLESAGAEIPVMEWSVDLTLPLARPFILILPEDHLGDARVSDLMPDVVVVKNIARFGATVEERYLQLYAAAGPHMTTVLNADDQLSVKLAGHAEIQKGRIFYFSKNAGVEDQIRRIGGVVSDGEKITLYNFNLVKSEMKLPLGRSLSFDEEVALLASLGAVLDVGLKSVTV